MMCATLGVLWRDYWDLSPHLQLGYKHWGKDVRNDVITHPLFCVLFHSVIMPCPLSSVHIFFSTQVCPLTPQPCSIYSVCSSSSAEHYWFQFHSPVVFLCSWHTLWFFSWWVFVSFATTALCLTLSSDFFFSFCILDLVLQLLRQTGVSVGTCLLRETPDVFVHKPSLLESWWNVAQMEHLIDDCDIKGPVEYKLVHLMLLLHIPNGSETSRLEGQNNLWQIFAPCPLFILYSVSLMTVCRFFE